MTLNSLIPITYGGGIKNLTDIEKCLNTGCEKIILNSVLYDDPNFLLKAVKNFGAQSIIINLDIKKINQEYRLFNHAKNMIMEQSVSDHLKLCQDFDCGEIVLSSVDNDGMLNGYDNGLIKNFRTLIDRPLIINGGCGTPLHMKDAILNGADACMAASIFYFTRYSYVEIKEFLIKENINVRI
tara:strand:- start:1458 stop:2006 length:549 start_codon:yes stop_codon:yes gene_type:complete